MEKPLAIKLIPKSLKDVLGQEHLIGKDKVLTNLIKNNRLFSMILYGKPGIGKTSIANAIVNDLGLKYRLLNATINNKKDIDIVIEEAKLYDGIILIIDEIHRLNKDKQDILLPNIESGLITLIGLTTSNPYHSINPAIRSRCQIFELQPLTDREIVKGLKKAIKSEYLPNIIITNDTINYIANIANTDLRFAYNLLEVAYYYSNNHDITIDTIKNINNKPNIYGDKSGDEYYNLLSALQKSIRGSDVDASIYYLARLIITGDFDSIFRRLQVIAYEDIGLANPSIGPKLQAVISACENIGLPEAIMPLSNIIIEMAISPKSNSAYTALSMALKDIENGKTGTIPKHLQPPYNGYLYPHDYPNSYVKQQYLPDFLLNKQYYFPKDNSKYEKAIKEVYNNLKEKK